VGILALAACSKDTTRPVAPDTISATVTSSQAQDLKPNGDWSNTLSMPWEPLSASYPSSNPWGMWAQVDEDIPNDDTDYMWRNHSGDPAVTVAVLDLTDPIGTPSASQIATLKVRWKVLGSYSTTTPMPTLLNYALYEGTRRIGGTSVMPSGGYVTGSYSLGQVGNLGITNWSALRIRLEAILKPANSWEQIQARVTWARLEIR
jgi:hypothetical protein